ncbi:MAG: PAS domain S-box protein [Halobacteriaceae archaeon]
MGPPFSPVRVLHIDDEPDFASMVATFLEREHEALTVETATNASEGLDKLAETEIDCIVSDYDMPGKNGIELLETVRENYPDLPFILFTGKGSEEVASDAIAAGVTDYLQKGSGTENYELLANRIMNAVEQYRATKRATELDRIRTLASDINQALVRAESQEEVKTRVCEIFSKSDPYKFAWIGTVDHDSNQIRPRTSAGIEEDVLEEVTVSIDNNETKSGPAERAILESGVAVIQNISTDPESVPLGEHALEQDCHSIAAVALEYNTILYGELVVYAERPNAFDDEERELLAELGSDIAQTLYAFEMRESLREERDRRTALFKNAPGPVIAGTVAPDGKQLITDVNKAFAEVFGYEQNEIIGKDVGEVLVPEYERDRYTEFRDQVRSGEATVGEVERITDEGTREFLLHIIPYGVEEGLADGWYAWYTDISDRKVRERKLQRYQKLVDSMLDVACIVDENGQYEVVNKALADLHGTTPTELEGKTSPLIQDLRSQHENDPFQELTEGVREEFWGEFTMDPPNGDEVTFEYRLNRISTEGKFDGVVAVSRDITERKEYAQQIQLMEQIVQMMNDGVVIAHDGDIKFTNPRFSELIGYSQDELVDMPMDEFMAPEYRDIVQQYHRACSADKDGELSDLYEIEIISNDDERIPIEINVSPIQHDGEPATLSLVREITARKERKQELKRQNERLEEFANIISHDLRNPLNIAEGRLELAQEECDSIHLAGIEDAHERMETLISDVLTLAREGQRVDDKEPVNLKNTVNRCWSNVETDNADIDINTNKEILADYTRLQELLENLIHNAVEHGGDDMTVTIGDLDNGFFVSDDGPGIDEENRDDVFDAGYTTTENGSGLGLQIVKQIAEAHGWRITLTESKEGGARFEFTGVEMGRE